MVNTCCVPKCKTGYKSYKNHAKIALFWFPSEEVLKNKWLKSILQKNWTLSSSYRVCAKHFYESDLITKTEKYQMKSFQKKSFTSHHFQILYH